MWSLCWCVSACCQVLTTTCVFCRQSTGSYWSQVRALHFTNTATRSLTCCRLKLTVVSRCYLPVGCICCLDCISWVMCLDSSITMLSAGRLHLLSWLYQLSYVSSAIQIDCLSRLEVFICHHFFLLLVIFSESLHNFCRIFIVDMFCIELQLVILWFYYLNCIISKKVLYYGYHASNIIEENCSGFCLIWVC